MASFGTNIDTVTNSVLVEGDVASIQFIRHFRFCEIIGLIRLDNNINFMLMRFIPVLKNSPKAEVMSFTN
jgi:hypothetical protein